MSEPTAFSKNSVRGFLHRPQEAGRMGLVLTHGAGSNCQSQLLVAVANAFQEAGFTVLRCDLPFRQRKPFGPPYPAIAAADRDGLRAASSELRALGLDDIYVAGHSYGGRQASILLAEDASVAEGLLLLSYPLHPPKKPDNLRTDHFTSLRTPSMFVHGTTDPFGTVEELREAIQLIPSRKLLIPVEGAGHELLKGRFDISTVVVKNFMQFHTA